MNLSNVECMGLTPLPSIQTPEACAAAACSSFSDAWQFSPQGREALCFVGTPSGTNPSKIWVGYGRNASHSWPVNPAPANVSYDDSLWNLVDAPHDALITTPYSQSSNNGQASIPKNVTWYRKHFVLPTDWKGANVEVYFEGVFALGYAWLNGVPISNR